MMNTQSDITFLNESELIRRAAVFQNLVLSNELRKDYVYCQIDSKAVGIFNLDGDFITTLSRHGFTFNPGARSPHDEMIYLAGHSCQRGAEIHESDCWAWDRSETNHQLTVNFRLRVAESMRGVVCEPHVGGNWSGGACHQPTIDKFVKAVAEHFENVHPLIQKFVDSEGQPVIFWSDIDLGGVKTVYRLFDELYGRNETVILLDRSPCSPFDPSPNPRITTPRVEDRLFVLEADQPKLFRRWKEQLETYRTSLV